MSLGAPGWVHKSTHSAFGRAEAVVGSVPGRVRHFTPQTLLPIPGGSRVQRCHKSWRTNIMEKLGMQLLGSAGSKLQREFKAIFFPGTMALSQISRHIGAVGGDMEPARKGAGSTELPALLFEIAPVPFSPPHPAPSLSQTGCFLPRIHLPAVPGTGLAAGTWCSAVPGSFWGGSLERGAGTAAPLCLSLPDPRCRSVLSPSRPSPLAQVLAEPFAS